MKIIEWRGKMRFIVYLNSIVVFLISIVIAYVVIKEKKPYKYLFVSMYMDIVVVIALYTLKIGSFGLLGFLGLVPFVKLYWGEKD